MDFRKEYLVKLRIWHLTPIKLCATTYPLGSLHELWVLIPQFEDHYTSLS